MKPVKFISTLFLICTAESIQKGADEVQLVLGEEDENDDTHSSRGSFTQELLCSYGSDCVPISQCIVMSQLIKTSCLQPEKIRELTCGFGFSEPMVCCPQSNFLENSNLDGEECGQPKLHNWKTGLYKNIGSQPWVVRVGFQNERTKKLEYLCSGSIIGNQVILTSAQCALAKKGTHNIRTVLVGDYDSSRDPDCTNLFCAHPAVGFALSHIIMHPGYEEKSFRHNIALLILKTAMNYSLAAQPICISERMQKYSVEGQRATLVGWGRLAEQTETQKVQQQLTVPIMTTAKCSSVYGDTVPITEDKLCAGGEKGKDACSGFAGAPLVFLPHGSDRYYQIGLVSFGSDKCGVAGIPSVYTRIDRYIKWIKKNSPKT